MSRELWKLAEALGADIARFERRVTKAAARPSLRRRIGPLPPRLPKTKVQRPTPHPAALPVRYRRAAPPTVLARLRALEEQRRGAPSPIVAVVRRNAQRVADAVRASLEALRRGLGRLRGRRGRAWR